MTRNPLLSKQGTRTHFSIGIKERRKIMFPRSDAAKAHDVYKHVKSITR
jgi:hypothetical protein